MLVESQNDSALLCTLFGFGSAAEQHDLCKTPVTEIEKEPNLHPRLIQLILLEGFLLD